VIDNAQAPEKKSWPKRGAIAALTWLTTLMLMVLLALLRARHRKPLMRTSE
jgi:uncharacterized protein involved in exopolysaccharide biosynthesis